jgi:methionine synthase II (cobalamin-independent)
LVKRKDNSNSEEAGTRINMNQKGRQMAKIIESEDIIVKQDCGFK